MVLAKFERELISAAQVLTGSFADLGAEIRTNNLESIGIFLVVDINDSVDIRFRALGKHTADSADEFVLPIKTVSASDIKVEDEFLELNDDVDQKVVFQIDTNHVIPYVQLQVSAGTVGATAGEIDSATLVRSQRVPGTY